VSFVAEAIRGGNAQYRKSAGEAKEVLLLNAISHISRGSELGSDLLSPLKALLVEVNKICGELEFIHMLGSAGVLKEGRNAPLLLKLLGHKIRDYRGGAKLGEDAGTIFSYCEEDDDGRNDVKGEALSVLEACLSHVDHQHASQAVGRLLAAEVEGMAAFLASFLSMGSHSLVLLPKVVPYLLASSEESDGTTEPLKSVVESHGGMMGPYLVQMLQLEDQALRECMARHVPVRILLPVVLEREAVGMLPRMVTRMDHAMVQSHHQSIVTKILAALDERQSVEDASVQTVCDMCLKLTEASFRPLFLRLVDWSTKGGEARRLALLKMALRLTDRLGSLFISYFRMIKDVLVAWLEEPTSGGANGAGATKKRKKVVARKVSVSSAVLSLALAVITKFARISNFAEEFEELLPVVLHTLSFPAGPGSGDGEAEAEDEAEGSLEKLDPLAKQVVECLVAMAVAGNDTAWKKFNNQVLMASRVDSARTKLACIDTCARLANHLKEDYMVLIPETVPFIAELIEDGDQAVQIACKRFVKKLEETSGEDISSYL